MELSLPLPLSATQRIRGLRCAPHSPRTSGGFTMVEMLVVIFIIGVLIALLMPALGAARASARRTQCQSNLRQFGVGFQTHAESQRGAFCTGAFDWTHDGAVTQHGWVADLVKQKIDVGQMLCPSNPSLSCEAYSQLLMSNFSGDSCDIPRSGDPPETLPDGTKTYAPCNLMIAQPATYPPNSEARRKLIEGDIYGTGHNTNYVPTWLFVRSEVLIEEESGDTVFAGNHENKWEDAHPDDMSCATGNKWRNSTAGPLTQVRLDRGLYPAPTVPLMGDGGAALLLLDVPIGKIPAGTQLVPTMTGGPVKRSDMKEVFFMADQTKSGPGGWFEMWNQKVTQDYSQFAPVHRGVANILFADGGVRTFKDTTNDGVLNNGFGVVGPYTNDVVEIPPEEMMSRWSLNAPQVSVAP